MNSLNSSFMTFIHESPSFYHMKQFLGSPKLYGSILKILWKSNVFQQTKFIPCLSALPFPSITVRCCRQNVGGKEASCGRYFSHPTLCNTDLKRPLVSLIMQRTCAYRQIRQSTIFFLTVLNCINSPHGQP